MQRSRGTGAGLNGFNGCAFTLTELVGLHLEEYLQLLLPLYQSKNLANDRVPLPDKNATHRPCHVAGRDMLASLHSHMDDEVHRPIGRDRVFGGHQLDIFI